MGRRQRSPGLPDVVAADDGVGAAIDEQHLTGDQCVLRRCQERQHRRDLFRLGATRRTQRARARFDDGYARIGCVSAARAAASSSPARQASTAASMADKTMPIEEMTTARGDAEAASSGRTPSSSATRWSAEIGGDVGVQVEGDHAVAVFEQIFRRGPANARSRSGDEIRAHWMIDVHHGRRCSARSVSSLRPRGAGRVHRDADECTAVRSDDEPSGRGPARQQGRSVRHRCRALPGGAAIAFPVRPRTPPPAERTNARLAESNERHVCRTSPVYRRPNTHSHRWRRAKTWTGEVCAGPADDVRAFDCCVEEHRRRLRGCQRWRQPLSVGVDDFAILHRYVDQ